jgi:2-hydroxychromene-2-carboxylate isomerase
VACRPQGNARPFVLATVGTVVSLDARRQARPSARARADRAARSTFYFDLAEPGTYLAAERVERAFPNVEWVPAVMDVPRADRAASAARALALGMPLVWPEDHPANRPRAMRVASLAAERGRAGAFVLAASRLAFCGGFEIDDPEVLAEAIAAAGLPLRECLQAAGDTARDTEIARAGVRLAAAGAHRLPAVRVGRVLFAGEERIPEAAAARRDAPAVRQA